MGDRTQEYKIREFMAVLYKIQARLIRKYGYTKVNQWREDRINRPKPDF